MNVQKSTGILAHVTSLPTAYGIGDLGPSAFRFIDVLSTAGQSFWQILPIGPIGKGNSPYTSSSTFAGNPLLISLQLLRDAGLISESELKSAQRPESDRIDFGDVDRTKRALLARAYESFHADADAGERSDFASFCESERAWLDDFALYELILELEQGVSWTEWPDELNNPDRASLDRIRDENTQVYRRIQFEQYVFQMQWDGLRSYANRNSIEIIGDLPIYVAPESADVWANRDLFLLDDIGRPLVVAGVPPDYFSESGQHWGNPIYNWKEHETTGFTWWIRRLRRLLDLVDVVRIDHFRGLESYWEIPAAESTARNGRWVKGPGEKLLGALQEALGHLPIIAEDLGIITDDVTRLRKRFSLPGMAVLQFALMAGESDSLLPERLEMDRFAYTGTHDNDTFLGWWLRILEDADADRIRCFVTDYLHLSDASLEDVPWSAMRSLMASQAACVIIPVQDLLALDSTGRMNTPGTESGNWDWRWLKGQLDGAVWNRLAALVEEFGRTNPR